MLEVYKKTIGLTQGDPAGIGPEVLVKAILDERVNDEFKYLIFGQESTFIRLAEMFEFGREFWATQVEPRRVKIIETSALKLPAFGEAAREGGEIVYSAIKGAVDAAKRGEIDALVTASLNKFALKRGGYDYPGHTELLAESFGVDNFAMMFFCEEMIVTLVTIHVPLTEVSALIKALGVYQKIKLTWEFLVKYLGREPEKPIGVLGLNPHAGEAGLFGDEEAEIRVGIEMARRDNIDTEGPFPADTFFSPDIRAKYSAIVAMYHDQGLIPIKMLAFDRAVNVTLGLPIYRTSPDHGTAYDISAEGIADMRSMKSAIQLVKELCKASK